MDPDQVPRYYGCLWEYEGIKLMRCIEFQQVEHYPMEDHVLVWDELINDKKWVYSIGLADPLDSVIKEATRINTLRPNDEFDRINLRDPKSHNSWQGLVGPRVLFIERMTRESGPHSSQIAQAARGHCVPMEDLKHVFVVDIDNEPTKNFCLLHLYTQKNGLSWPDPTPRSWEHGSSEYKALLGTPIGKVVAYIVLGVWDRGTHRISKIVTWGDGRKNGLQMRFEIEEMQ